MESFVTLYIRTNKCFVNEEIFLYKYWHVYAYFLGNACFSKWPVSWCEEICDNLHGRGLVSKTGCKQINYYVYVTYELQYMYIIHCTYKLLYMVMLYTNCYSCIS